MWGVRVLLTATVMVFGESAVTREVISPSNGKCPPLWLVIGSPFTHYKDDHKGHEYSQAHATYNRIYHVSIIVSTLEKQHNPGVPIQPRPWYPSLSVIPNPPNKVPQARVLSDVIETGGDWHQDGLSCLWSGFFQSPHSLESVSPHLR